VLKQRTRIFQIPLHFLTCGPGLKQGFVSLLIAVPNLTFVLLLFENIMPLRIISGSYSAGDGLWHLALSSALHARLLVPNLVLATFRCFDMHMARRMFAGSYV